MSALVSLSDGQNGTVQCDLKAEVALSAMGPVGFEPTTYGL